MLFFVFVVFVLGGIRVFDELTVCEMSSQGLEEKESGIPLRLFLISKEIS